jgi:hypothetical protein
MDFMNISQDSKRLFKDWFIMDITENSEMDNDESEGIVIIIYFFVIVIYHANFFYSMFTI